MALFDPPQADLREYTGSGSEPHDFDEFWHRTLTEARAFEETPTLTKVDSNLTTVDVFDVRFPGFGGQPIAAWLQIPRGTDGPLPTVVEYVGYGGGRGYPEDALLWASSGFAHLKMDTRGQGSVWSVGETGDTGATGPAHPGFMTRGILDREDYYYRRLIPMPSGRWTLSARSPSSTPHASVSEDRARAGESRWRQPASSPISHP